MEKSGIYDALKNVPHGEVVQFVNDNKHLIKKSASSSSGPSNPSGSMFQAQYDVKGASTDKRDQSEPIRGCALVISNSFSGLANARPAASEKDVENMRNLWKVTLGCELFDTKIHKDQGAQEMKNLLKRFSETEEKYDYVVVIISTHGGLAPGKWVSKYEPGENEADTTNDLYYDLCAMKKRHPKGDPMVEVFFGNDERPVREREIKEYFYNTNAKGLQHVKKFFILDYCRGDVIDEGVIQVAEISRPKTGPMTKMPKLQEEKPQVALRAESLMPTVSDIVIVYATQYSFVANERPEVGSWLITIIAEVFTKYAKQKHVVDMLTMVNKKMKTEFGQCLRQAEADQENETWLNIRAMSIYESSLVDDFYLCKEAAEAARRV